MSVAYFIYLFLFSGLEYSLTFLVHQRFHYTRSEIYTLRCCLAQHCTATLLKWFFELPLVATVSDCWNTYDMPFLSCLAYLQKLYVYGIETQLFSYFLTILRWLMGMQQDTFQFIAITSQSQVSPKPWRWCCCTAPANALNNLGDGWFGCCNSVYVLLFSVQHAARKNVPVHWRNDGACAR